MAATELKLGIPGFTYADLQDTDALRRLYDVWHAQLVANHPDLARQYDHYRQHLGQLSPEQLSAFLVEMAPTVSHFVVDLFGVKAEWHQQRASVVGDLVIFRFKDEFVKRRALKVKDATAEDVAPGEAHLTKLGVTDLADERNVALAVCALLDRETDLKKRSVDDPELIAVKAELTLIERWAAAKKAELERRWLSFRFHGKLPDALHLVHIRRPDPKLPELMTGPTEHDRPRDGFTLTDRRMAPREILAEVEYCLYCHDRDKDSCSKGLRDNKTGAIKPNALGVPLNGCPLDEKISEMHITKRAGDSVGALALVCMDNPMLPGTGHRICNDCMKACVYQTQQPVNIPQIETAVLTDVLSLPWGFEIYTLLTRWNPLNVRRPYPLPYRGKDVLVVGLGPAGYTLAHHLLNEGFGVVGVDGLKIEPLPEALVGDPRKGVLCSPVHDFKAITAELDERISLGFGGVSEYGITVRWDKNFLTVLYANLARRSKFRVYGGVRFGGTLTLDEIWALGFDHVAIAVGAGKPTFIEIENNLIRGIRKASDFLMSLQLQGAYKKSSLANLQVRLPAIVIGGGLTGIDTATELAAYYVVQVEKMLERHEHLLADIGEGRVAAMFDGEEKAILAEQLEHGRAIRAERAAADAQDREPNFHKLVNEWGGVSLVYRKRMVDSPAYRLNHEEVEKFLEEGVNFIENMSPLKASTDEFGAVRSMTFERQHLDEAGKWHATGELVELPARTVCIAAGTSPNTIYEKEYPGTFQLDKRGYFTPHKAVVSDAGAIELVPEAGGFFTSYQKGDKLVSYYGDNHPKYAGSVVKAMASAKHGFVKVAEVFGASEEALSPSVAVARQKKWDALWQRLDDELLATVVEVVRLAPTIVEVIVRAKRAARHFQPGQFYRLQNFESSSPSIDGVKLTMEGLALTGAWTDPEKGLLSMIVLEMGPSSRMVAMLKPGEPVVVMGPTGTPTEIPTGETVLLAGGGLGNAVLFSIGKALRSAGCKVIYFAGYRKADDVFRMDDLEAAADEIVWALDAGAIVPRRAQDKAFTGNIVQAIIAYARGQLGPTHAKLNTVSRIIAIGSDRMMRAVQEARHGVLAPYLDPKHVGIGSINSPMQCMMKEICAQCLQKHRDPRTGKETVIFSCYNQDQELDSVDFNNLASRLRANTVQEKLANLTFDRLLKKQPQLIRI